MYLIVALTALHAMPGVFWAGTTFAMARAGGAGFEKLAGSQVGAALVTLAAGAGLWSQTHGASLGSTEIWLLVGIAAAIAAAALQFWNLRTLRTHRDRPQRTLAVQRAAAGLLALTVLVMVTSRYA